MSSSSASNLTGRTVHHYHVLEQIGEGGMGVVYKAQDTRLDRVVALKFLAPRLQQDLDSRKRFEREAKAAASLNHPNICTVFEIGDHEGQVFIAMAHIEGEALDERITERPLKLDDAIEIARQAAEGLSEAHRHGVVHRDIKPGNIMLSPQPNGGTRVTIMDFGLAQLSKVSRLTASTTAIGTVSYMSPEQTFGGQVDHRSDLWSLGVVLYEAISGQCPFRGHYEKAVMYAITEEEHEPLTSVRSGLPIELDWIVDKALAKEPSDRYQSADELLIDLKTLGKKTRLGVTHLTRARTTSTQRGDEPTVVLPRAKRAAQRGWRGLAGWAAAATLGLALGYVLLNRPPAPATDTHYHPQQISFDEGLSFQPAISPEGTIVAYSSDRSGEGNLDIWLQHFNGGEPIRLTDDPADDTQPAFSPDGSRIAYRSERESGGLYLLPVLGGQPRLLAEKGRDPSFSPDGSRIAYWIGESSSSFTGEIYVLSINSGTPQRIRSDFRIAREPVWLAEGERIIFAGQDAEGQQGWWITGLDDAPAVRVSALDELSERHLSEAPYPRARLGRSILFAATLAASSNLWSLDFNADGSPGRAVPITSGAGFEEHPSASRNGSIAFSLLDHNVDIWELPLDSQGRAAGEPRRVTTRSSLDMAPSVSLDGRTLAFESNRTGQGDVWIRNLETGEEHLATISDAKEGLPRLSNDGRTVAYRRTVANVPSVMVSSVAGGSPKLVCEACSGPYDWTPDETGVLARSSSETNVIRLFPLDGSEPRPVIQSGEGVLYEARFSPDGAWIAFHTLASETSRQIFVAPFHADRPSGPDEWIPVTDGAGMDRNIAWSADGRVLYFLSERDGSRCIWAQALTPQKQAAGEPFELQHFSNPARSMTRSGFALSATADRLYYSLSATHGNVWMLQPDSRAE